MLSWQIQNPGMAAELNNGSASRYEQTRMWTDINGGGPIIAGSRSSSSRRTTGRRTRATTDRTIYGELPDYKSVRNEGFGKLTVTPTRSTLLNVSLRDEHRLDKSNLFGQAQAPTQRHRQRGVAAHRHRRRLLDHQRDEPRDVQVDALREQDAEPPRQRRQRLAVDGDRHAPRHREPGHAGAVHRAGARRRPGRVQRVRPRRSSIATATPQDGVKRGGGLVGYGSLFDKDDFFRDSVQFAYNITFAAGGMRHNLHAGYQRYKDAEHLLRNSNGWGSITVPGGTHQLPGHADLLPRRVPAAGLRHRAAAHQLGIPLAEHRGQRHASTGRTGRSTSACSPATTSCTARD